MERIISKKQDKSKKKTWRKHYQGERNSANFDRSCKPDGSCPYCQSNRQHAITRQSAEADDSLKEIDDD